MVSFSFAEFVYRMSDSRHTRQRECPHGRIRGDLNTSRQAGHFITSTSIVYLIVTSCGDGGTLFLELAFDVDPLGGVLFPGGFACVGGFCEVDFDIAVVCHLNVQQRSSPFNDLVQSIYIHTGQ